MPLYFGNFDAFLANFKEDAMKFALILNLSDWRILLTYPFSVQDRWTIQIKLEVTALMKFGFGIVKGIGYPIGFLLQLLTFIYLFRGHSGYARSAKNWFLLVLGADIASTLYRLYDLVTQDFKISNPYLQDQPNSAVGEEFTFLMWGLRRLEDKALQNVLCKIFFIILYFPIYLSPISLTVSAIIRAYCVKFPLRAKSVLTTKFDRVLMASTILLSLAIAVIISALSVGGWSNNSPVSAFGLPVFYGDCAVPKSDYVNTAQNILFVGTVFSLTVVFLICLFNLISTIVIILVLFESKKNRKKMSASDMPESNAEVRATAMLLGMNVTLFLCFFISRVLSVSSQRWNDRADPIGFVVAERMSNYLFNIPYYTNWLFIAGLTRKFYEFYLPCLAAVLPGEKSHKSMATQIKSLEESKAG